MTLRTLFVRITIAVFAITAAPACFAAAGKVVFSYGQTAAFASDGTRRDLKRGDSVESGETLKTLEGRLQVKFNDGGFISLQPRTEFKIDDYRYAGVEDGSESAIFGLVRGAIRAVTGAIGQRDKSRYQIKTKVATIGIRGTAFTAMLCEGGSCVTPWGATLPDGLYTKTGDGVIYLSNNAGSVDLAVGGGGFVPDIDTLPIETSAPPPTTSSTIQELEVASEDTGSADDDPGAVFSAGEQFGSGDGQEIVIGDVPIAALGEPSTLVTFAGPNEIFVGATTGTTGSNPFGRASPFVFTDGFQATANTRVSRSGNGATAPFDIVVTANPLLARDDTGTTSSIFVERFSNGTLETEFAFVDSAFSSFDGTESDTFAGNESFFQVSGSPTTSIPTSGQANYVLEGASRSATVVSGPLGIGATSASIGVNFATAAVDVTYQVNHLGNVYSAFHTAEPLLAFAGQTTTAYVFGSGGGAAFGGLGACSTGCFSVVGGFLSGNTDTTLGNTPSAAGFTYTIFETNPIQGGVALRLDPGSIAP